MSDERLFNSLSEYIYLTIGEIDVAIKNMEEYSKQVRVINENLDLYREYLQGKFDPASVFKTEEEIQAFKQLPVHIKRNLVSILGNMQYDISKFSGHVADIRSYSLRLKDFQYKPQFKDLKQSLEQELKAYEIERLSTKLLIDVIISEISCDKKAEKINTEIHGLLK